MEQENRMLQNIYEHEVDYDKYDERMSELARRDDERWENDE